MRNVCPLLTAAGIVGREGNYSPEQDDIGCSAECGLFDSDLPGCALRNLSKLRDVERKIGAVAAALFRNSGAPRKKKPVANTKEIPF